MLPLTLLNIITGNINVSFLYQKLVQVPSHFLGTVMVFNMIIISENHRWHPCNRALEKTMTAMAMRTLTNKRVNEQGLCTSNRNV